MLDATTAAHSLITLASPTLHDTNDKGMTTPPRSNVQNMVYKSPDHTRHLSIKCKGTKRPRENLVLVLYDAAETELAVPFIRGEDPQLFFERRNKITKETLEADMRNDVYCTWRKEMMSILSAMFTMRFNSSSQDILAHSGTPVYPAATAPTSTGVPPA